MSDEEEAQRQQAIQGLLAAVDSIEPLRELWRGLVANLVGDGFSSEQAHLIVTNLVTGYRWNNDSDTT